MNALFVLPDELDASGRFDFSEMALLARLGQIQGKYGRLDIVLGPDEMSAVAIFAAHDDGSVFV